MTEEQIIQQFTALCEGKLSSEMWKIWILENAQSVENLCGKRYFLKIKPKESASDKANAYFAQTAVFEWLQTKNISVSLSDIYKNLYEKEFDDFCQAQAQKQNELRQLVTSKWGHLKEIYPKFFKQLTQIFDETTQIEKGKIIEEIQRKEAELGVSFSEELKAFFQHISLFRSEGVEINFEVLEKETFGTKAFLILGEFFKYGDGDKLLYDIENQNIVVFAHAYQPPKFIKQADTITAFVEKTLFQYLKQLQ